MIIRKAFPLLARHLSKKQITVITGLRRVGKSTALNYLLDQVPHKNKLYLDFERIENRALFNEDSYKTIERGLEFLGLDLSNSPVLALDEIQLVPNSTSVIKSLYDSFDIKILATGSSSFYLKNHFSESLAGRKQIFELWPLDFEEYLLFNDADIRKLKDASLIDFHHVFYEYYNHHYEHYIKYGGFPEVALTHDPEDKINYLKDILNSYIELDIKLLSDFSASDGLYKLIKLLANRVGSRVDYSKIAAITGLNRHKVKEYINLLEYTYFIRLVKPFTSGIDKEVSKQAKIYFTDNGLLNITGTLSSGAIFENAICGQLSLRGDLNFFEKSSGTEIDFILDRQTAFEVKETCTASDLKTLEARAAMVDLKNYKLIGRYPPLSGFRNFIWGGSIY
ncbi:predicted ATPase, AAA+ superfamily [Lentimicrobium saccharophilum]|uniref:Predicted ATPase, AAA+ superfamily n=1 Tax=Lentimicrobium saccharophilum TaxID=1678841 RepID=A0A0S7BYV3_9BACT|nr:ATP-binding protein [Lentimicrobium saccharophilum]GAP42849.1 predicted ATPase, AAA+ superfamily [Lentimicrobium saccharophilum]